MSTEPNSRRPQLLPTAELGGLLTALGPATLLIGLLYYFGWVRTNAVFRYFGVDPALMDLSTQDYVLRSASSVFWPAMWALVGGLLMVLVVPGMRAVESRRWGFLIVRAAGVTLAVAGVLLLVLAAIDYSNGAPRQDVLEAKLYWAPTLATVGLLLLINAFRVLAITDRPAMSALDSSERTAASILLVALTALGLFWSVGEVAETRGRQQALDVARGLQSQPGAIVYSAHELFLDGPGVNVTELDSADGSTAYRYTGLRYIARSGAQLVLVPCGWTTGSFPRSFVLPVDGGVRIDLVQAGGPSACEMGD